MSWDSLGCGLGISKKLSAQSLCSRIRKSYLIIFLPILGAFILNKPMFHLAAGLVDAASSAASPIIISCNWASFSAWAFVNGAYGKWWLHSACKWCSLVRGRFLYAACNIKWSNLAWKPAKGYLAWFSYICLHRELEHTLQCSPLNTAKVYSVGGEGCYEHEDRWYRHAWWIMHSVPTCSLIIIRC